MSTIAPRLLAALSLFGLLALLTAGPARSDGRLPLAFEANRGQTDARVDFLARGSGHSVFLTGEQVVLSLRAPKAQRGWAVRLALVGAKPQRGVCRQDLPGRVNYFVGKDARRWRTDIPTCAQVCYPGIYEGVDVVYYGTPEGRLEHDFVVHPGVDPGVIEFRIDGADRPRMDQHGDLVLESKAGTLRLRRPVIYQELEDGRHEIAGAYERRGRAKFGFDVANYDSTRPLIIDPVLVYSSFLGGIRYDEATDAEAGEDGSVHVVGFTDSPDFPVTAGAFQGGGFDVFVTKLNRDGTTLVFSTYLGGTVEGSGSGDFGTGIAVDGDGSVYVTGFTSATDFPTTPGAFQNANGGNNNNAFVTKLNGSGNALIYSTYLGGNNATHGFAIAVDEEGSAYVAGRTTSQNFPTTPGAFQITRAGTTDAFVTKFNGSGTALAYSTLLGGSLGETSLSFNMGIAVDAEGSAYVTGVTFSSNFPTTPGAFQITRAGTIDAFVTKLNVSGTGLVYSTYLGGSGGGSDFGVGIAVDEAGFAYVTGFTNALDFPTTPGAFQPAITDPSFHDDGFVTKLNDSGSALVYSTYVGGSGTDVPFGIAVTGNGLAHITGYTDSQDYPTTANALQSENGGLRDAFVTKLNAGGTALAYSSYLGGSLDDTGRAVAVKGESLAYVTGATLSADFPTTAAALQPESGGGGEAFITKLCLGTNCNEEACLDCGADAGGDVTICHVPPGNSANSHTLHLPPSALAAHCSHGDFCGPCKGGRRGGAELIGVPKRLDHRVIPGNSHGGDMGTDPLSESRRRP